MMDQENENQRERRYRRAQERLGSTKVVCTTCGEDNPHCFEAHHMPGKRLNKDFTVNECMNCHRKLTDAQKDHPKPLKTEATWLEQGGHLLLHLADFLLLLVEKLRELGLRMIEEAGQALIKKSSEGASDNV